MVKSLALLSLSLAAFLAFPGMAKAETVTNHVGREVQVLGRGNGSVPLSGLDRDNVKEAHIYYGACNAAENTWSYAVVTSKDQLKAQATQLIGSLNPSVSYCYRVDLIMNDGTSQTAKRGTLNSRLIQKSQQAGLVGALNAGTGTGANQGGVNIRSLLDTAKSVRASVGVGGFCDWTKTKEVHLTYGECGGTMSNAVIVSKEEARTLASTLIGSLKPNVAYCYHAECKDENLNTISTKDGKLTTPNQERLTQAQSRRANQGSGTGYPMITPPVFPSGMTNPSGYPMPSSYPTYIPDYQNSR